MNRVCFCRPGVMSQCAAPSKPESIACWFYEKSTVAERCMYLCESLSNHCDSYKAQQFGYHPPIVEEQDYALVEEVNLVEMVEKQQRTCINCILYTCSYVIKGQQTAQPLGGLTGQDLINMASACSEYDDEASMNARIAQSLRGNNP